MLVLASFGLLVPAIFHELPEVTARDIDLEHELSIGVSIILMLTYLAHLVFSLVTHKSLFNPENGEVHDEETAGAARTATVVLVVATVLVAIMSEILVGAVEHASHVLGMNKVFVGVVVVAIVGNAAEHSTAVLVATQEPDGPGGGNRAGFGASDRPVRGACAGLRQLSQGRADGPAVHVAGSPGGASSACSSPGWWRRMASRTGWRG